jgi:hypothetical protein
MSRKGQLTERLIERARDGDPRALWELYQAVINPPRRRPKRGARFEHQGVERRDLFKKPASTLDGEDADRPLTAEGRK